jgi:hypothetical protein
MNAGERWFSWRCDNGNQVDWWSHDVVRDPRRFVHHEWGKFTLAVHLGAREAQIQINEPCAWLSIKFKDVINENERYALEAACDARQARFAAELFLRIIGRDDMVDLMHKANA